MHIHLALDFLDINIYLEKKVIFEASITPLATGEDHTDRNRELFAFFYILYQIY